jgi:hypothetical protein
VFSGRLDSDTIVSPSGHLHTFFRCRLIQATDIIQCPDSLHQKCLALSMSLQALSFDVTFLLANAQ